MTTRPAIQKATGAPCGVARAATLFELRKYTARPQRRDALIAMFEAHFLDAYESAGAQILGTFRNLDAPDQWVWIRAFADHETRATALTGFYASAVWQELRNPANDLIAQSSDAFLLRALSFTPPPATARPGIIECARFFPRRAEAGALEALLLERAITEIGELGGAPMAAFATSEAPNSYPRQKLRKTPAFVLLTRFASAEAHQTHVQARSASHVWRRIEGEITTRLAAPQEWWRLQPSPRSALR